MAIYDDQQEIAFAGMKCDSGDDRVESFPAGIAIPFGRIVGTNPLVDTAAHAVDNPPAFLPAAIANFKPRGVSIHSHAVLNTPDGYALYDCVSVMTRGLAWVEAAAATAIVRNTQLQYNAAGHAVAAAGTAMERAVVRGPVTALASGLFIVPVEFDSPMDADAVV
jgi:hypothetical protein